MSTSCDFRAFTVGDQRYLDYVPGCFEKVLLLRHKGCNFKHWMVKYGEVKRLNGRLFVGDEEVVFFHFSQNLGNIMEYDPLFHPELVGYIARLKEARSLLKVPYFSSQGHLHNQNGLAPAEIELGLLRGILRYLDTRVRLILPTALVSGRLKRNLKLAFLRKFAPYHLLFGGSQALLKELTMTHTISPETMTLIHRSAFGAAGSTVTLGTMDGVPAIGSVLARKKTIVIDSFEARYFPEGKTFINPKLRLFEQNLAKFGLSDKITLLRHHPNNAMILSGNELPVALLVIDCTFGSQLVVECLTQWFDSILEGGLVLCILPDKFDIGILRLLDSKIVGHFSETFKPIEVPGRQALLYRKIGTHGRNLAGPQKHEIQMAASA